MMSTTVPGDRIIHSYTRIPSWHITTLRIHNVATQRIKHLESEKIYFEMAKEFDLGKLKTRNKELSLSLENAQEEFGILREQNGKLILRQTIYAMFIESLKKEIVSLEEKNSVYMEWLKERENYLEAMQQHIEDLNCSRETHLEESVQLKAKNESLKKEIISLEEKNSVYMEQLKEKDNYIEAMKQLIEMDHKSHLLQQLQQERNDLMKKLRQLERDLVILQLERNHVESDNKEMVRKLEDLQLLLEEKSSQLQEELKTQFNKSQTLEILKKKCSDLGENNAVLLEMLEKTDNGDRLLLKKVEDLECALMLKENENLDIVRKLGSLEMELKLLTMKNVALEEVTVSKEVHSESHSAGHNIGKCGALCCQAQSQLTKTASVLKSSVATNTDISGSCQCQELTKRVNELKITNVQQKNMIGDLNLQIEADEFRYQKKVKEQEERVSFYKRKNMELRTDLCCDCSGKLLQARDISVQTDEVKDEDYLFTGAGGSGIITASE